MFHKFNLGNFKDIIWSQFNFILSQEYIENEYNKNYETYNNERKVKVFASNSESQISCDQ